MNEIIQGKKLNFPIKYKFESNNSEEKKIDEFYPKLIEKKKKKRILKTWTKEEDYQLENYSSKYNKNWVKISKIMQTRSNSQCAQRFRRLFPEKVRKPWTKEEDCKVKELMENFSKDWQMIAKHLKNRTGKQVRERYINNLDPKIRHDSWSFQEDCLILKFYLKNGSKWSQISKLLNGRPENMVKNRFYSYIKKNYIDEEEEEKIMNEEQNFLKMEEDEENKNFNFSVVEKNNISDNFICKINLNYPFDLKSPFFLANSFNQNEENSKIKESICIDKFLA